MIPFKFSTLPGQNIQAAIARKQGLYRQVAGEMFISAKNVEGKSKARSPIGLLRGRVSGRMKLSIHAEQIEGDPLAYVIGTNVRSLPSPTRRRRVTTHSWALFEKKAGGGVVSSEGFRYPLVQELREDFQHPRGGQAHFMGESAEEERKPLAERLQSLFRRAWGGR